MMLCCTRDKASLNLLHDLWRHTNFIALYSFTSVVPWSLYSYKFCRLLKSKQFLRSTLTNVLQHKSELAPVEAFLCRQR